MIGAVLAYVANLLVATPAGGTPPEATLHDYTQYTLANGLKVILLAVRDVPLVRVHVRYHVGGADEPRDLRGLAHVVEHVTFEGTAHISAGARARALHYIGAIDANASTYLTSTDYYFTVPADYTEMALWLESDRMGFSGAAVTRDSLRAVQRVVANERRQRFDAEPYGGLRIEVARALYPVGHPYHGHNIGSLFEIAAATPAEAREFVTRWYSPTNATLVLVGDLPATTRDWIEKYFGSLARVDPPPHATVTAVEPRAEVALRAVEPLGRSVVVVAAWPTPALYTPQDAVADVVAEALNSGAFRRLAGPGAPSASFLQHSLPVQSRFYAEVFGAAGTDADALAASLDLVLAKVARGELTEPELRRARERLITRNIAELQTLNGRAARLQHYAEHRGSPDWLAEDVRRYREVSPNSVVRFAIDSLRRTRRVILRAVPATAPARRVEDP